MPLLSFRSWALDGDIEDVAPELEAVIDWLDPAPASVRDVTAYTA